MTVISKSHASCHGAQDSSTDHVSTTTHYDELNGVVIVNHHHHYHYHFHNNDVNKSPNSSPNNKLSPPILQLSHEVTPAERLTFPYCLVGLVEVEYADVIARGTATLLDPQTIVTAAHVVDRVANGPIQSITFRPGYSRDQQNPEPFGSYSGRQVDGELQILRPPQVDENDIQTSLDYAYITLDRPVEIPNIRDNLDRMHYPTNGFFPVPTDPTMNIIAYPTANDGSPRNGYTMIHTSLIAGIEPRNRPDPNVPYLNWSFALDATQFSGSSGGLYTVRQGANFQVIGVHVAAYPDDNDDDMLDLASQFTAATYRLFADTLEVYDMYNLGHAGEVLGVNNSQNVPIPIVEPIQVVPANPVDQLSVISSSFSSSSLSASKLPMLQMSPRQLFQAGIPILFSLLNSTRSVLQASTDPSSSLQFASVCSRRYAPNGGGSIRDPLLDWTSTSVNGTEQRLFSSAVQTSLDLYENPVNHRPAVAPWNGSGGMIWRLIPSYFTIRSKLQQSTNPLLVMAPNDTKDSVIMASFSKWDTVQQWRIVYVSTTGFFVINRETQQFLSWNGGTDGKTITLGAQQSGSYSLWTVGSNEGGNSFAVRPFQDDDQNWDIPNGNLYAGCSIYTWNWQGGDENQIWCFCAFDSDDAYNLAN